MAIRMAAKTSCGSLPVSARWENSGATKSPRLRAQRDPVTTLVAKDGGSGRAAKRVANRAASKRGAPGGTLVATYFALKAVASRDIVAMYDARRMWGDKLYLQRTIYARQGCHAGWVPCGPIGGEFAVNIGSLKPFCGMRNSGTELWEDRSGGSRWMNKSVVVS
jgi:hypothetical protein